MIVTGGNSDSKVCFESIKIIHNRFSYRYLMGFLLLTKVAGYICWANGQTGIAIKLCCNWIIEQHILNNIECKMKAYIGNIMWKSIQQYDKY